MSTAIAYPRPLSVREAAMWLGLSEKTVVRHAQDGTLAGRKVGRQWRFSQRALAEFAGVAFEVTKM